MSPWVALPQAALGLLCRRCLHRATIFRHLAPLDILVDVSGYLHRLWHTSQATSSTTTLTRFVELSRAPSALRYPSVLVPPWSKALDNRGGATRNAHGLKP